MTVQTSKDFSGEDLAVLSNRFYGINRKMSNTMLRTGRSGVLSRARDFSVCIVTADCRLLSAVECLPIHVLSGADVMARHMAEYHQDLRDGDAFIHNSPFHGNSHAADQCILVPVMDDAGKHRFTVVVKAHQADIGNSIPTTLHATARDLFEEGALLFNCALIQRDRRMVKDILRMAELRIRLSDQWRGDLLAAIGAARIGELEIKSLASEVGWDRLSDFADHWLAYSERRMEEAIRKLKGGRASTVSVHDHFPGTPEEGIAVKAHVSIDAEAGYIEIDLTDCPDNVACGLNLTEATSRSAALVGVFNSIDHRIPKNAGSIERVRINLREGAVVGIPRHPCSTSLATTNVADHCINAVQRAIAEISPGAGMGDIGYGLAPTVASVSGVDPRNSKPFVNMMFLGHTAGAGSFSGDCWLTLLHAGGGGLCNIDSVEVSELYHPVHIHSRTIVPDTEGAGRYRGAPALRVEFGTAGDAKMDLFFASDGTDNPPIGTQGGGGAAPAEQHLRLPDGTLKPLDKVSRVPLSRGYSVIGQAQGGGGYGPPTERDADQVAHDVAEKWITAQRAFDVYGVVLVANGQVDRAGTDARRAALRGSA